MVEARKGQLFWIDRVDPAYGRLQRAHWVVLIMYSMRSLWSSSFLTFLIDWRVGLWDHVVATFGWSGSVQGNCAHGPLLDWLPSRFSIDLITSFLSSHHYLFLMMERLHDDRYLFVFNQWYPRQSNEHGMAMAALFLCNPPQTSTSTNECTNRSTSRNRCHLREIAFSLNSYKHPLDLAFPCRNPRYSRLCYTPVSSPPVRPHRTKWSYLRLSRQNTRDIDLRQCALHAKWPVNHHR